MKKTVYVITYVVAGTPWTTVADSDMKRDMAVILLDEKDLPYTITVVTARVVEDWGAPQLTIDTATAGA